MKLKPLINDFWRNISSDLLSWCFLIAGIVLLVAYAVLFVSSKMSLQGDPDDKLIVSLLLGVGVILILLSIRIKAKKADRMVVVIPVATSVIALLIYAGYRYYPGVILAYFIYACGAIYLLLNTFTNLTKTRKEGVEIPSMEEKWSPIFTGLNNIGREASEIEKNISNIYHIHMQLKDRYNKTLKEVIDIYSFAMMLNEVPDEYVEPFRAKLREVFRGCGVEEWSPKEGEPAPDGCNKKPASEEYPYPEGAVAKVHSPGFRTMEGQIIVPPLVEVVIKTYNENEKSDQKSKEV